MIVDFHTHTFPEHLAARAIAGMQENHHAAAFADGTVAGLKAQMTESGVDLSVILPVATNPLKLSSINDVSIGALGQEQLVYFGAMHPMAENWKEELKRLAVAGVRGIKLHPFYQNVDVDDVRMLRILGTAAELGLLAVVHSGNEIACPGQVRCSPEMAANAIRQLQCSSFLILAHMGGWKNWERVAENLASTQCYIDTAISLGQIIPQQEGHYREEDLPLLGDDAFVELVRAFGSQRVLFGTDSPWASQKQELEKIRKLPLTQQEKDDLFGSNACRLLNLQSAAR